MSPLCVPKQPGWRNNVQRETKLFMRAMAAIPIISATAGRLNLFFFFFFYYSTLAQKPQIICYNPLSVGLNPKAV